MGQNINIAHDSYRSLDMPELWCLLGCEMLKLVCIVVSYLLFGTMNRHFIYNKDVEI